MNKRTKDKNEWWIREQQVKNEWMNDYRAEDIWTSTIIWNSSTASWMMNENMTNK